MDQLFLFTGENHQALSEKLRFWEKGFEEKYSSSNLERFENPSSKDLPRLLTALESMPFLSEKRLVVIKGLPEGADVKNKLDTEALEEVLDNLPESTIALFVSPKPDKRTRFAKALLKKARVERFELLKGVQLKQWVAQRFQQKGKSIAPDALEMLVFACAEDSTRLSHEIDKLSLLEGSAVAADTVRQFVSFTPEAKIFHVLDGIGKGSSRALLSELSQLLQSGQSLMMIFFMIVRQFRLLIQVQELLSTGAQPGVIQKRVGLAPFQVTMLTRQARLFSGDQLRKAYAQLADIDLRIKTGRLPFSESAPELLHTSIDHFLCSLYEH